MRYPTLPLRPCLELAEERLAGQGIDSEAQDNARLEAQIVWKGDGDDLDLKPIRRAAREIGALAREGVKDRDRIEGEAAVRLFEALAGVDPAVLDDPGFWRYLSVGFDGFWRFIEWREYKAFRKDDPTPFRKYFDGRAPNECVLPRMYRRILALGGHEDPQRQYRELAALPKATDFWRSHVIRVQTSASPAVVRAFARMQRDRQLTTKPLREFVKWIRRVRSNVLLSLYDDREADEFVGELRAAFDERQAER